MNYKDPIILKDMYCHRRMSTRDIAAECDVSAPTIRYYIKKFGIKTRSISDGMIIKSDQISKQSTHFWSDRQHRAEHSKRMRSIQRRRTGPLSKSAKKNWQKNRVKIVDGIRKSTTDAKKQKISESVAKTWNDARRETQSAIAKSLWQDDKYKHKTTTSIQQFTQTEDFRQKVSANSRRAWQNKQYRQKQALALSNLAPSSILDKCTISILAKMGIEAQPKNIGPWTFDVGFEYQGRKILIECQGTYWHSKEERKCRDRQKKSYYDNHLASEYELHYIYEHQFYGLNSLYRIICHILGLEHTPIQFDFTDCHVMEIKPSIANEFLSQYHYLAKGRAGVNIGCYLGENLIAVALFSGATRQQSAKRLGIKYSELLELNRLCIHPQYHKKNFASWFLARCLAFIPAEVSTLIAYSDLGAGHSGSVYKAAGWQYDGKTKPSYWYIDQNGTRYYKKSVWDQAKRSGMSEWGYASDRNLQRIDGPEVLRFIKKLKVLRFIKKFKIKPVGGIASNPCT